MFYHRANFLDFINVQLFSDDHAVRIAHGDTICQIFCSIYSDGFVIHLCCREFCGYQCRTEFCFPHIDGNQYGLVIFNLNDIRFYDSAFSLDGKLMFAGKTVIKYIFTEDPQTITALFRFRPVRVENPQTSIRFIRFYFEQDTVRSNAIIYITNFLDYRRSQRKGNILAVQNNIFIAQTLRLNKKVLFHIGIF